MERLDTSSEPFSQQQGLEADEDWDESSQFSLSLMSLLFSIFLPERHLPTPDEEDEICSDDFINMSDMDLAEPTKGLHDDPTFKSSEFVTLTGELDDGTRQLRSRIYSAGDVTSLTHSESDLKSSETASQADQELDFSVEITNKPECILTHLFQFNRIGYKIARALCKYFPETEVTQFRAITSGSSSEGLSIPPHAANPSQTFDEATTHKIIESDMDLLIIAEPIKVGLDEGTSDVFAVLCDNSDELHPGFIRLSPKKPTDDILERCIGINDKSYLSSSKLMAEAHQELSELQEGSIVFTVKGPALKLLTETPDAGTFEFDFILALPCLCWPSAAEEWKGRDRSSSNWPTADLIKIITDEGCLVVPTPHDDSVLKDVEWRISFSKAEKRLAHSLSTRQKHAYVLLKILLLEALSSQADIRSYHIKTTLFWTCEQISNDLWTKSSLASCVLLLFDRFMENLEKYTIPLYFIPSNNVIAHVPKEKVDQLVVELKKIRQKPLSRIFKFDNQYKFVWSLISSSLERRFDDLLGMPRSMHSTKQDIQSGLMYILMRYFHALLDEHRYDLLMEAVEDHAEIVASVVNIDEDLALNVIVSVANELETKTAVQFYRKVLLHYPDTEKKLDMLTSNLACLLHASAHQLEDGDVKEELLQEVDSTFKEATSGTHVPALVDYTHFLCKLSRVDEAIPLLQRVLSLEREKPTEFNSYGEQEKCTLDTELQEFVDDGEIESLSSFFAYYLLVRCYVSKGLRSDAQDTVNDFSRACEQFAGELENPSSWILLGLSHFCLQNYQSAHRAFSRVVEVESASERETAHKYMTLCDAKCR